MLVILSAGTLCTMKSKLSQGSSLATTNCTNTESYAETFRGVVIKVASSTSFGLISIKDCLALYA